VIIPEDSIKVPATLVLQALGLPISTPIFSFLSAMQVEHWIAYAGEQGPKRAVLSFGSTASRARGQAEQCKASIETIDVELDNRGLIFIVDEHRTGLHILELTGAAHQLADFTRTEGAAGR
jgi:hypothetical protein